MALCLNSDYDLIVFNVKLTTRAGSSWISDFTETSLSIPECQWMELSIDGSIEECPSIATMSEVSGFSVVRWSSTISDQLQYQKSIFCCEKDNLLIFAGSQFSHEYPRDENKNILKFVGSQFSYDYLQPSRIDIQSPAVFLDHLDDVAIITLLENDLHSA
jgi:hypothetical protein